ncbi:phosphopentomutase [Oceanibium sediminis]|uniref:phosphopentomutase n=1 Tax=Oceanibium sediminis TaxID=2026339 RepID=UPI000DD473AA|nr:phosphopentomutase [Oceanibium sediminis]
MRAWRAILCVMDSVGCGGAPDAAAFGDEGANTLGHIAEACAAGRAEEGRSGPLHLPNLDALGLGAAIRLASGAEAPGLDASPTGRWGAATEVSNGKDTPSGHWELSGVPVPFDWHYFPHEVPTFPAEVTDALIARAGLPGILGNCHASGMPIIRELGQESIRTGKPICYTSIDSVFQIAAHEEHFGLDRLMEVCRIAAELVHPMNVGRVIARPFVGEGPGDFKRTANRRDLAIPPPEPTICDRVAEAGGQVWGIGKIKDIFAGQGITHALKGDSDMSNVDKTLEAMAEAAPGSLIFANYVDFDTLYGHPRDVAGYARNLEAFDARVPELIAALGKDDLLIFTADHGNDPTWTGTDHTRERVPVLMTGAATPGTFGHCGFADVGESIAAHLGLAPGPHGRTIL